MNPHNHSTHAPDTTALMVRSMQADDYPRVADLWKRIGCRTSPGSDDLAAIALFLGQNPDLCTVAELDNRIVGALLCGEDGRGGFIHRVSLDVGADRVEVTAAMVRRCVLKLRALGVTRCYLLCNTRCLAVEIGRSAPSGLGEAVETLTGGAIELAAQVSGEPIGEPGLSCEIITPHKRK